MKLNHGRPMASAIRPKGSCPDFDRGYPLVLGTGCTLRHWSGITAPFLAATGDLGVLRSRLILCRPHMPQSLIDDPGLTEIERLPCPKCHGPMTFTGMVSRPDGLDVRTFECSLCNCTEKVTVETK